MVDGPSLAELRQAATGGNWLDALSLALFLLERGLLTSLHALGLAGTVHGQPAWPWPSRIAHDNLVIDRGHARAVAIAAAALVAAPLLAAVGWAWRRGRAVAWSTAVVLLIATPWPDTRVLLTAAHPTSLHRSPTGYTASSIDAGAAVYAAHCAGCHGDDGTGNGPDARALPRWPPSLIGPLLWRRTDGELFWRVRAGLADRHGRTTMPGFGDRLDDRSIWAVLDFLKANAAGQSLRRLGEWPMPVEIPDLLVRCDDGRTRPLRAWSGQRLRIVADAGRPIISDPRFTTIALVRGERAMDDATPVAGADERGGAATSLTAQAECQAIDASGWTAFARIAGVDAGSFAGVEFLTDRRGWLRARAPAGRGGWSLDDLLCRSSDPRNSTAAPAGSGRTAAASDPLDELLRRMDAEPVRLVRGGVPH
ncbi:MAG: cytochrome c [Lautropia sp.]